MSEHTWYYHWARSQGKLTVSFEMSVIHVDTTRSFFFNITCFNQSRLPKPWGGFLSQTWTNKMCLRYSGQTTWEHMWRQWLLWSTDPEESFTFDIILLLSIDFLKHEQIKKCVICCFLSCNWVNQPFNPSSESCHSNMVFEVNMIL